MAISRDPIGFNGDQSNQYRYVENQVTTLTDPSGLKPPIRPSSRPPYRGPYNPYIPGEYYGRNAPLPYYHPRVTSDGRLVGRGHSLNQIARAAQIRQQRRLNEANTWIMRRKAAEAFRQAREYARWAGMTEAQIRHITTRCGNQQLASTRALIENANIAGYTNAIARYLGEQRGVGRETTIAVIATRSGTRGDSPLTFTVFSNQYDRKAYNYFPPRVKEAVRLMREHGIPIRIDESVRPRFGEGQPKRGLNPHAEEIAEQYALGRPVAMGTNRRHCDPCMSRMSQQFPMMIQASQPPQANTAIGQGIPTNPPVYGPALPPGYRGGS